MYEVIDPYLAWRRLFHSLKTDLEAKEPSGDVSPRFPQLRASFLREFVADA